MTELFYKLPQKLTARQDLTPADKLIYAIICNYRGKNETAWPSQTTLASKSGMAERTVRRCLQHLQNVGLVEVIKGRGVSNHYTTPANITGVSYAGPGQVGRSTPDNITCEPRTKCPPKRIREKTKEIDKYICPEISQIFDLWGKPPGQYDNDNAERYLKSKGLEWCLKAIKDYPNCVYLGECFNKAKNTKPLMFSPTINFDNVPTPDANEPPKKLTGPS